MVDFHLLSAEHFSTLSQGIGGHGAVDALRNAQRSKHLLLIRSIVEAWPDREQDRDAALAVLN
jgi:hypothetical protein